MLSHGTDIEYRYAIDERKHLAVRTSIIQQTIALYKYKSVKKRKTTLDLEA